MRTLAFITLTATLAAAPAAFAQDTKAPDTKVQDTKVQTTTEANRESLSGAAKAPLRDLNVIRTQVPDVLVRALADPYQRPTTKKCQELVALIQPLDQALGADIDVPLTEEERTMMERGRPMALGAVAGLASDAIPFRGAVRYLTGAAKHDEYVQSAILAGSARRAYLKGLGEARGCKPPATPSHVKAGSTPPAVNAGIDRGLKPRYPIKR
jgi:hypothetical protein